MSKTTVTSELSKGVKVTKQIAILSTVFDLLRPNNQVTTLEVKVAMRADYPDFYTTQADISTALAEMADEKILTFVDNGSYRIYSDPRYKTGKKNKMSKVSIEVVQTNKNSITPKGTTTTASTTPDKIKGKHISRTQALDFMANNKGHFFTATFITKKNKLRTINGQFLKDQGDSKLGYVKVREVNKLKNGKESESIRNVNLQTLEELRIGGKVFNVG